MRRDKANLNIKPKRRLLYFPLFKSLVWGLLFWKAIDASKRYPRSRLYMTPNWPLLLCLILTIGYIYEVYILVSKKLVKGGIQFEMKYEHGSLVWDESKTSEVRDIGGQMRKGSGYVLGR